MSRNTFFFTKLKIYLPVLSLTTLIILIFSIYMNEYILFILNKKIYFPYMKQSFKKETLILKLGIFTYLDNENFIFCTKILLGFVIFFLGSFLYSFFKAIFMDPGYLPDPSNFEYNLVLQNLDIREEHAFLLNEDSEASQGINASSNIGILDSASFDKNSKNLNHQHVKAENMFTPNELIKNEIFENSNRFKKKSLDICKNTKCNDIYQNGNNKDTLFKSIENEIILNNNDLSNNCIYSDISGNNDIIASPNENKLENQKSFKVNNINNLLENNLRYNEDFYIVQPNILIENQNNSNEEKNVNSPKSNKNSSSKENHKYLSRHNSIKENANLRNSYIKMDKENSREFLIEENNNFNFANTNIENLKEKNDININIKNNQDLNDEKSEIMNIPNTNQKLDFDNQSKNYKNESRRQSKNYKIESKRGSKSLDKNYENEILDSAKIIHNDNSIIINNNFAFYINQDNENIEKNVIISPIFDNIIDNSTLSKIKQNQIKDNEKNSNYNYNLEEKDKRHSNKKNNLTRKRYSSQKHNKNRNFSSTKNNITELNVKNYIIKNKRYNNLDSYRKNNHSNLFESKNSLDRNFTSETSDYIENESSEISSSRMGKFFEKISKVRKDFIKGFASIVANGPICSSEGVNYRNYLEKFLNFNKFNLNSFSNSYFHSILYNQSNMLN